MDTIFEKLKRYFPALPLNAIAKIYCARCERLRLLMNHGIPEDIYWMIEAKVRFKKTGCKAYPRPIKGV